MRLRMHWLAGPGLEEVRITQWKVSAEDDQGKRLTGIEEPWEESTLPNRDVSLALTPPTRGARTLRKVEGTASIVLPLERGKVEFAPTEAGQTKPLGGARVKLQQVDAKEKSVSFSLKGRPCPGIKSDIDMDVASEVWHGSSGANAVRVVAYDAEGTEIPRGSGTHMSSDWLGRRTWTIEFEAVPSRIVLEALVRGEQREIPFSFTDIPLPE
jgi:hypothetical protein